MVCSVSIATADITAVARRAEIAGAATAVGLVASQPADVNQAVAANRLVVVSRPADVNQAVVANQRAVASPHVVAARVVAPTVATMADKLSIAVARVTCPFARARAARAAAARADGAAKNAAAAARAAAIVANQPVGVVAATAASQIAVAALAVILTAPTRVG